MPSRSERGTPREPTGRYDVHAVAEQDREHDQVLKHGDSFAVFDRFGDIRPTPHGEEGIYHRGTRHLSGLVLRLGGRPPLLLGATTRSDNARISIDLTNADYGAGADEVAHNLVHVARAKVLLSGACHERLVVRSFARRPISMQLELLFDADFADIFEVRGMHRRKRGRLVATTAGASMVSLRYRGLDGLDRRTLITLSPAPADLDTAHARYDLALRDARATTIDVVVRCESGGRPGTSLDWDAATTRARRHVDRILGPSTRVTSSNEIFNDWLDRSISDVAMLTSRTAEGPYPYAGIPWFSTPFGRDGLITALQCLWIQPQLARGVLSFLAATQASSLDPKRDAAPGKILHEMREGEMAALGEVPFGRYYGSEDATPLFVMLAAAHLRQTNDMDLQRRLLPHVERAIGWMATDGDPDGDGFLEYERSSSNGLSQQGWKDSADSIFHDDGQLAVGPVALCEVQGYAYAALVGSAELSDALGDGDRAGDLRRRAAQLRDRFDAAFWDEELGTYALALDGQKRPCRVVASNAGHALLTGIALPQRAERLAETLTAPASYSGWGIRTVAAAAARYNPMSYHNGSIWPHDNALVALGLSRYGFPEVAARILSDIFDAARHFELARLPELFCGFTRRPHEGPTRYPVACSPQAWSAGAVYMLLQAAIGLEVDAPRRQVRFRHAVLPASLDWVRIERLRVGAATVDLEVVQQPVGAVVRILRREGDLEVVSLK